MADRFHLLMNLTGMVNKVVERSRPCSRLPITYLYLPLALAAPPPPPVINNNTDAFVQIEPSHFVPSLTPHPQLAAGRRGRRREKKQKIALHEPDVPGRKLAKQLEIRRPTVEGYLRTGTCAPQGDHSALHRFFPSAFIDNFAEKPHTVAKTAALSDRSHSV